MIYINVFSVFEDIIKFTQDNAIYFAASAAISLGAVAAGWVKGPLKTLWTIGGVSSLAGAAIGFGSGFIQPSKANYAYPEFYPYDQPGYFQYLTDPRMSQNFSHGIVSVPRVSNALAASPTTEFTDDPAVDNPQYSPKSPEKDLNHVHALDTPPAPDKTNVINYEPDHQRGACNPQRDSNHIFSNIGTY